MTPVGEPIQIGKIGDGWEIIKEGEEKTGGGALQDVASAPLLTRGDVKLNLLPL